MKKNIFLVEKRSSLNEHRPSLALARFSTLHKAQGDNIYHVVLSSDYTLPSIRPDKVYVSIIFSWDIPKFIAVIQKLLWAYPTLSKNDIVIGGVAPFFMKDYIFERTGIEPVSGCVFELDHVIPDPTFFENDTSYVFTMRSCPNNCQWCVVSKIESEFYIIDNWKEQINLNASRIVIMDNNLLAAPYEHRKEVFDYLTKIASVEGTKVPGRRKLRSVEFDGGFDARHMTDENLEMIKRIRWRKIRVAFDRIDYEEVFDRAMDRLIKAYPKVSSRGMHEQIECYVLFGCPETNDSLEDTLYRAYKLLYHHRIFPYLMRYQPLESLTYKSFVAPNWDEKDLVDIARWVNNRRLLFRVPSYKYFFGRKSDGKSLSRTSNEQKRLFSQLSKTEPGLDYSKLFKGNVDLIREEINERKILLSRMQKGYNQLQLLLPA